MPSQDQALVEGKNGARPSQADGLPDAWVGAMSDTDCAEKMNAAKAQILRRAESESPIPPRFL